MKTFFLPAALAVLTFTAVAQEKVEPINPADAKGHIGKQAVVVGRIVSVRKTDKVINLNFEKPFPQQPFSCVIFPKNFDQFPDPEELKGKTVEVSGTITEHQEKPQIVLQTKGQLRVIEKEKQ